MAYSLFNQKEIFDRTILNKMRVNKKRCHKKLNDKLIIDNILKNDLKRMAKDSYTLIIHADVIKTMRRIKNMYRYHGCIYHAINIVSYLVENIYFTIYVIDDITKIYRMKNVLYKYHISNTLPFMRLINGFVGDAMIFYLMHI